MFIELEHVSKSFQRPVLKDLTYRFESGKMYVIKGVSGCGKTTLLNILGGVEREYDGEIRWDIPNEETGKHHRQERTSKKGKNKRGNRKDGLLGSYIFQKSMLVSGLSVLENLRMIRDNREQIEKLSQQLDVADLLEKRPEQLSGGERQRISVVRALLSEKRVLLADEPTAALDRENADRMASILAGLRDENRILVVVTHEDAFDRYADEIIALDYGSFGSIRKNPEPERGHIESGHAAAKSRDEKLSDISLILKRKPQLFSLKSLLPATILFLVLVIASAVQNNIERETVRMFIKDHPMDLISTYSTIAAKVHDYPGIEWFDYYHLSEGGRDAYYLPERELSVFMVDDKIAYGGYPEAAHEVIIGHSFAEHLCALQDGKTFHYADDFRGLIGSKLDYGGECFTVSGILGEATAEFRYDWYYRHAEIDESMFIPYETIRKMGEPEKYQYENGYFPDLPHEAALLKKLELPNDYYRDADWEQREALELMAILFIVYAVAFIIICIFLISLIRTDLHYRRKELGYLQIFGLSRKHIQKLVQGEYLLKFAASAGLSIAVYLILAAGYLLIMGAFPLPDFLHIGIAFLVLFLIYFITVKGTVRKFLKISIRTLID